jgi:hypothetical protein
MLTKDHLTSFKIFFVAHYTIDGISIQVAAQSIVISAGSQNVQIDAAFTFVIR